MIVLLLILSVALSITRNLLSKEISGLGFGTKNFFITQSALFICGGIALLFAAGNSFDNIALLTVYYAVVYGVLLLTAQYCYTSALKQGNVGICSTIYSLGFILPTLSGSVFWNEPLTGCDIAGIITVIPTIVLSGMKTPKNRGFQTNNEYLLPLVFAMFSSGGLGILQKVQQNSPYPEQKNAFIIIAFILAGVMSFVFSLFAKSENKSINRNFIIAGCTGVAFGFSNLCNTILAGRLDSAVFFPVLNISTILFSLLFGLFFYKEKLSKKDLAVLMMGIASILLITAA